MIKQNSTFNRYQRKKNLPFYIALITASAIAVPSFAQETETADSKITEEVIVTGMRASVLSAQAIKRDAASIVDSVVADDIGKLPDRSVTEAIQRIPGVTVSQFASLTDPEHFAAEGSGVAVRGLTQIRSELNGRDLFSANSGGRALSFEDVPAELMAGVDVIKSPTADMVEGGLGGIVNLRTHMPFDFDDQQIAATIEGSYGESIDEYLPSVSGIYSNRFDTSVGEMGFLVDIAKSETKTRTDGLYQRAWYTRDNLGDLDTTYLPLGADWRRVDFSRDRLGGYAAFQWAPTDNLELYATYFRSDYDLRWDENAMFIGLSSRDVQNLTAYEGEGENVQDLVFDSSGHFQSGSITSGLGNGVTFGSDTRVSKTNSVTDEFALGFKMNVSDSLNISGDIQRVNAKSKGVDNTISLGVEPRYVTYNLAGDHPEIYVDPEWLSNPANYHWSFSMPFVVDNKADETAARLDFTKSFENSVITAVKTGVRFTSKEANNRESDYHWKGMYQSWMRGPQDWQSYKDGDTFPSVTNLQDIEAFTFDDFYRGNANVPLQVYVPTSALVEDYPNGLLGLRERIGLVDADAAPDMTAQQWSNIQQEKTSAVYVSTDFSFEDKGLPLTGNIGARVVQTTNASLGYLIYPSSTYSEVDPVTGEEVTLGNPFQNESTEINVNNDYTHVLPNLNLKYAITDDMYIRFAAAKGISRPEFNQLKSYLKLEAELKSDLPNPANPEDPANWYFKMASESNPYLEPLESTQLDVSWEWYFSEAGSTHVNIFSKDIDNYIRKFTGAFEAEGYTYVANWPENLGTAKLKGVELGWSQFFDFLPEPFDGLGIQANYTYIDSSTDVPLVAQPIDTDGTLYDPLPYEGISKNSYNIVGMYSKYGFEIRLAYNWRSDYLMSVGANGFNGYNESNGVNWKLPVYSDSYGQLDGSVSYDINDNVTVSLSASNITNSETKTYMDQNAAGAHPASFFVHDTRYDLSLRLKL